MSVQHPMMMPAQQNQIVENSRATIQAMHHMMSMQMMLSQTTRPPTPPITQHQAATQPRTDPTRIPTRHLIALPININRHMRRATLKTSRRSEIEHRSISQRRCPSLTMAVNQHLSAIQARSVCRSVR
jgi:hypothetical protein